MPKAIRIAKQGSPQVMEWVDVEVPPPGAGEAQVEHEAVGLNYIDCYHRSGLYPRPLPSGLGLEGAGIVRALGAGVSEVRVGDRVAYTGGPIGAYAQLRNVPAHRLVQLPEKFSFMQGAGMMLQGLTAQYLLRRTYRVKPGDTILVHAAAGGVGLIMCQWAKQLGAKVIGTVGTDAKAELAKANGCDYAIVYTREDFVARVKEITKGQGLPVVYDSIGKDTWAQSLDCLAPLGMMVSFGSASGPIPPVDSQVLNAKGSLFFTRPGLAAYIAKRDDLLANAADLFDAVGRGAVKIDIRQTYPLRDVAKAHQDLEGRRTTGTTVLMA
jgi:NADPH2:quinone reductase